jgi:uncharacterized membrane protein YphA (DoxX/SURF4 family)
MYNLPKYKPMRKQKEPVWLMVVRIALACVFLFSGMSKAIDPVGWGFKMDEYFQSFGMGFMHPFSVWLGILVNIAEFTLGFMLLFKIRVRLTMLGYLLFMVFFFFLTAWLALAEHLEVHYGYNFGVVTDCGCFGQAIVMNNLETFLKNVVLLMVTLIVFAKRSAIPDIRLTLLGQWLLACVGGCMALAVQLGCLRSLPLIDFSNWKKGNDVVEIFIEKPAEIDLLFLYKNDREEEKLLSMADIDIISDIYPNFYNEFHYVDRIDSVRVEAIPAKISGFSMLDHQGKDFASIFVNHEKEHVYLLFIHDLDEANPKAMKSKQLQDLVAFCQKNNIDFAAITNTPPDEIKNFMAQYKTNFPIYYNPIDPVKGPFVVRDAIRSNPGLIILEKGVVKTKKPWRKF